MRISFKITQKLLASVMYNLRRPHVFAAERVGFLLCRPTAKLPDAVFILAGDFHPVADEDYLDDPTVGATMGPAAIRKALELAYKHDASMFHVHIHEHLGKPRFSGVDKRETAIFVPDFWHVQPGLPHGAIVFSKDSACGNAWLPGVTKPLEIAEFISVGVPIKHL